MTLRVKRSMRVLFLINEMMDMPLQKDISSRYFIHKTAPTLGIDQVVMDMLGYDTKSFFASDYTVQCGKSFYQGIPCYYVLHSAIEYVFIDSHDLDKVLKPVQAKARQCTISILTDELDAIISDDYQGNPRDVTKALKAFYAENVSIFTQNRILISSLSSDRELAYLYARMDRKTEPKNNYYYEV